MHAKLVAIAALVLVEQVKGKKINPEPWKWGRYHPDIIVIIPN